MARRGWRPRRGQRRRGRQRGFRPPLRRRPPTPGEEINGEEDLLESTLRAMYGVTTQTAQLNWDVNLPRYIRHSRPAPRRPTSPLPQRCSPCPRAPPTAAAAASILRKPPVSPPDGPPRGPRAGPLMIPATPVRPTPPTRRGGRAGSA